MHMWGITLMVMGALSLVLPLFGRQFLLVSALGLSGVGPAAVGIVLLIIGWLIFAGSKVPVVHAGSRRQLNDDDEPPTTVPAPPPESARVKQLDPSPIAASPTGEGRFALDGGDYVDAYAFGLGRWFARQFAEDR